VVDVFSGSGTTCLAAKQLRRKYIGFELNAEYHKSAEERLENAALVKAA
jgi:DNA modification methylase